MYAVTPEDDILQGDVLKDHSYREVAEPTTSNGERSGQRVETTTIVVRKISGFVVVVSQSCDASLKNHPKRDRLVVAPLVTPDPGLVDRISEKVGGLANLNLEPVAGRAGFLNLFYYAPHPSIGESARLVDFSSVRSVRSDGVTLEGKVLQLAAPEAKAFRLKLGAHFARPDEQ